MGRKKYLETYSEKSPTKEKPQKRTFQREEKVSSFKILHPDAENSLNATFERRGKG